MIAKFDQLKSQRTSRDALEKALEAAGAEIRGSAVKCPFHEDKRSSGSIYEGTDGAWRFKCHSCGWGGDLIDVQTKSHAECLLNRDRPTTAVSGPRNRMVSVGHHGQSR